MDGVTLDPEPEATGRIIEPTEGYPVGVHKFDLPAGRIILAPSGLAASARSQPSVSGKIWLASEVTKRVRLGQS
jgi:hypothetical protein